MSDEQRAAVKVQHTGSELADYMDALQRIADAVRPYERVMFLGGPLPSAVAMDLRATIEAKLKNVPPLGAPMPRAADQR